MKLIQLVKTFIILTILCLCLTGCFSTKQMIADSASGLFGELALSANRQSDIALVRQGLPSYLMLIDGMIGTNPENQDLLLAGAQAYASYASLLEEEESSRASQLIQKAKVYALKALEQNPLFKGASENSLDLFQMQMDKAEKSQAPFLFGVGSIWGTWIAQGPDSVEGMADLPKVEALMDRVLKLDPGYYYGGPHLFKGIMLSARPVQYGGNLEKALTHFQQALKYSQGKFLMTQIFFAQYYAKQRLDRDLFVKTLNQVLSTPADIEPDLTLINTLAHEKAKRLLNQVDEFF
jgi:tetratricopeptide (TPR) repeat protein